MWRKTQMRDLWMWRTAQFHSSPHQVSTHQHPLPQSLPLQLSCSWGPVCPDSSPPCAHLTLCCPGIGNTYLVLEHLPESHHHHHPPVLCNRSLLVQALQKILKWELFWLEPLPDSYKYTFKRVLRNQLCAFYLYTSPVWSAILILIYTSSITIIIAFRLCSVWYLPVALHVKNFFCSGHYFTFFSSRSLSDQTMLRGMPRLKLWQPPLPPWGSTPPLLWPTSKPAALWTSWQDLEDYDKQPMHFRLQYGGGPPKGLFHVSNMGKAPKVSYQVQEWRFLKGMLLGVKMYYRDL